MEKPKANPAQSEREVLADTLVENEEAWRWNAGTKAIGDLWCESVEEAEHAQALAIVAHIRSVTLEGTPMGDALLRAIATALAEEHYETMAQIEERLGENLPEGPERDAGRIVMALCEGPEMRAAYLEAVHRLRARAAVFVRAPHAYRSRLKHVTAIRFDGTNDSELRSAFAENRIVWGDGVPTHVSTEGGAVQLRNGHWVVHKHGARYGQMLTDREFQDRFEKTPAAAASV